MPDATGTPTSPDNIPTYSTSADPPSGKGFNTAMAAIQTALNTRIKAALMTGVGDLIYSSGVGVAARLGIGATGAQLRVSGGLPVWSAAQPLITTSALSGGPPASPSDGDIWIGTGGSGSGDRWTFQYDASWVTDAYKWKFMGGVPATSSVEAGETVNSTVYVDLATVGPSITVPRAGIYVVSFETQMAIPANTSLASLTTVKIGAAAASDGNAASWTMDSLAAQRLSGLVARTQFITCAANDVLKLQYRGSGAVATHTAGGRELSVTPVRII